MKKYIRDANKFHDKPNN